MSASPVGTVVVLRALSKPDLNGCVGVVVGGLVNERYPVRVWRAVIGDSLTALRVRPANLEEVSATAWLIPSPWLLPRKEGRLRRDGLIQLGFDLERLETEGFELPAAGLGSFFAQGSQADPPVLQQLMLFVTLAILPEAALKSLLTTGRLPRDAVAPEDIGRTLVEIFDDNLALVGVQKGAEADHQSVQRRLLAAWRCALAGRLDVSIGPTSIDGHDSVLLHPDPPAASAPPSSATAVRIGLVCMTKKPQDLETWLGHYRMHVGIERFFLRVEDSPELEQLLGRSPWRKLVEVIYVEGTQRDKWAQMDRQAKHVEDVVPRARAAGLSHLLHCDDDELVYCQQGAAALRAELAAAPAEKVNLHMRNLESGNGCPLSLDSNPRVVWLSSCALLSSCASLYCPAALHFTVQLRFTFQLRFTSRLSFAFQCALRSSLTFAHAHWQYCHRRAAAFHRSVKRPPSATGPPSTWHIAMARASDASARHRFAQTGLTTSVRLTVASTPSLPALPSYCITNRSHLSSGSSSTLTLRHATGTPTKSSTRSLRDTTERASASSVRV